MNKICKAYMYQVKALLPVRGRSERIFIKKLTSDIDTYCEEEKVTTMEALYDNYGKPCEVVTNYISSMDSEPMMKRIRTTKLIKRITVALLIIATVISAAFCVGMYYSYQEHKNNAGGTVTSVIVEHN
ncbi:MAG: hypothetical protein IJ298_11280 [Ruminococcus sp.]|nr:hypothetical protein [Ruminococcus sp.]